jgi:hypothetical protein
MAKGETVMPVPGGELTGSEIWKKEEELDTAIIEADAEEATEEYVEGTDDLPELS